MNLADSITYIPMPQEAMEKFVTEIHEKLLSIHPTEAAQVLEILRQAQIREVEELHEQTTSLIKILQETAQKLCGVKPVK